MSFVSFKENGWNNIYVLWALPLLFVNVISRKLRGRTQRSKAKIIIVTKAGDVSSSLICEEDGKQPILLGL